MPDQRITNYIYSGLKAGHNPQKLKSALIQQGWPETQINEAFHIVQNYMTQQQHRGQRFLQHGQQHAFAESTAHLGFFSKIKKILTSPSEFFQAAKSDHMGDALKFYAIVLLIPASIMGVLAIAAPSILFSMLIPEMGGVSGIGMLSALITSMALVIVAVFYIASLAGTVIGAGIYHIIALLFGARKPYSETYKAMTYSMTPFLLIGWVSFLLVLIHPYAYFASAAVFMVWSLIVMIKGLSVLQEISGKRAAMIILLPMAVLLLFVSLPMLMFASGTVGTSYPGGSSIPMVRCSPCFTNFAYVDYGAGELTIRTGPQTIEGLSVSANPDTGPLVSIENEAVVSGGTITSGEIIKISGIDTSPEEVDVTLTYMVSSSGVQHIDIATLHN